MKKLNLPTAAGSNWWVMMHDFSFREPGFKNVRPIKILTYAGQLISRNKAKAFQLGLALENKIFAVRHNLNKLRSSLGKIGDPILDSDLEKSFVPEQEVIADLEAYISAIYSALEIAALMNHQFSPSLPRSFRKQAKKYKIFTLKRKVWLQIFFDIRSELTHYNSPLPILKQSSIVIEFQNPRALERFSKGKYSIHFLDIYNFYPELVKMLDRWAVDKLKELDQEAEMDCWKLNKKHQKYELEKVKLMDLLVLMKNNKFGKGKFVPRG